MHTLHDLIDAATTGNVRKLDDVLAREPDLVNATSDGGWTPLHLAAHFGHLPAIEHLLSRGADVHARSTNDMRNTPLHAAAAGRHIAAVHILLSHGADVNAQQQGGWTPLHAAAQNGDREIVVALLEHGADVNLANDAGATALALAEAAGHGALSDLLDGHAAR